MAGGVETVARLVHDEVRALDPQLPILASQGLEERVEASTAEATFYLTLMTLFAAVSLTLATVGLYGVVSFLVTQKRREIGIRLALGAEDAHVLAVVMREGLAPALVGIVLGLGASLAGGRYLESLLYGVSPTDPLLVASVVGFLIAVVTVACLIPGRRATRLNPAVVLRADAVAVGRR
jgi:ABC-type antimicrobial peptide transport system permease subunit